jgi:hypothetical protein
VTARLFRGRAPAVAARAGGKNDGRNDMAEKNVFHEFLTNPKAAKAAADLTKKIQQGKQQAKNDGK